MPPQAVGANVMVTDNHAPWGPRLAGLVADAGIGMLRYPGGSFSDQYHWRTHSWAPEPPPSCCPPVPPGTTLDDLITKVAAPAGAEALVTVNYGSNESGTAGGDPAEAAAWVKDANIAKHYGVHYWEIGNELWGDQEVDLHPTRGDPTFYGTNALLFEEAMKREDPSIAVGVALVLPSDGPRFYLWNAAVMRAMDCRADFVTVHWYPQDRGQESDLKLLISPGSIPGYVRGLRSTLDFVCGARASAIEILLTETNSVARDPGDQTTSVVNALFLADSVSRWLEAGVRVVVVHVLLGFPGRGANRTLHPAHDYGNEGLISEGWSIPGIREPPAFVPYPSYWGLAMLHQFVRAGDMLVAASASDPAVVAHAALRPDGSLAILILNDDPSSERGVRIDPGAGTWIPSAMFTYGLALESVETRALPAGLEAVIPPYSMIMLVLRA